MHAENALAGQTRPDVRSALLRTAGARLERSPERLPERLDGDDARPTPIRDARPLGRNHRLEPELCALLEATLRLGGRPQPTREAELAERCDAFAQRRRAS